MTSDDIRLKLDNLKNEVWDLARESLDLGEVDIYRTLMEVAEQLTPLMQLESVPFHDLPEPEPIPEEIEIFARYKGEMHKAVFNRSRANGGRGECVFYDGDWMTASRAAHLITHNNVNGWRFWKYSGADGKVVLLERIR